MTLRLLSLSAWVLMTGVVQANSEEVNTLALSCSYEWSEGAIETVFLLGRRRVAGTSVSGMAVKRD